MSPTATGNEIRIVRINSADQLTPSRLEQAADAGADAFAPDPVFLWMRPHPSDDNAERHRDYFHDRIRRVAMNQGKDHLILAVRGGEQGDTREEVLGWAIFDRTLSAAEEADQDFFWGHGIPKSDAPQPIGSQLKDDKAEDEERVNRYVEAWNVATKRINREIRRQGSPELIAKFDPPGGPRHEDDPFPNVKLFMLAVNPKYQRQGVGKKLVEWGIEQSDRQGVPQTLSSSPMGDGLYRKCGFVDLGFYVDYATKEEDEQYGGLFDKVLIKWPPNGRSS